MHIDGVKRMVQMRGGIQQVKLTSPLTARMVAWQVILLDEAARYTLLTSNEGSP